MWAYRLQVLLAARPTKKRIRGRWRRRFRCGLRGARGKSTRQRKAPLAASSANTPDRPEVISEPAKTMMFAGDGRRISGVG